MREETMFSWIPIHQETTRKMLALPEPQKELLATLREMEQQGLKVIRLEDQNPQGSWHPLKQIDPFTWEFWQRLIEESPTKTSARIGSS